MTPETIVAAMRAGDRRVLAQALSQLEIGSADQSAPLMAAMLPHLRGVRVIGFTGPPGAGKSTLVNSLIDVWRGLGQRVAVIAVDPSSPVSGGAILGDRIRMSAALDDDGVFVRSLASHGHLGGLSPAAVRLIDGFDCAGYDLILLETVGTGQNEVDVAAVADVGVVIVAPGLGDGIQAMKSGLLEIADVLVVNKADRPDAHQTAQQLHAAVSLREGIGRMPEILETTATSGVGVDALATEIDRLSATVCGQTEPQIRRRRRGRYIVERLAVEQIRTALGDANDPLVTAIVDELLGGSISSSDAVRQLLIKR